MLHQSFATTRWSNKNSKPTKLHPKHCMKKRVSYIYIYIKQIHNQCIKYIYICVVIRILPLGSSKSNFLGIFFPSFLRHQRFMVRPVIVLLPDDARIPGWRGICIFRSSTLYEVDIVSFFLLTKFPEPCCWVVDDFFSGDFQNDLVGSIVATSDPSYPKLDLLKGTRLGLGRKNAPIPLPWREDNQITSSKRTIPSMPPHHPRAEAWKKFSNLSSWKFQTTSRTRHDKIVKFASYEKQTKPSKTYVTFAANLKLIPTNATPTPPRLAEQPSHGITGRRCFLRFRSTTCQALSKPLLCQGGDPNTHMLRDSIF